MQVVKLDVVLKKAVRAQQILKQVWMTSYSLQKQPKQEDPLGANKGSWGSLAKN
jgi:hypothetical protein